ncbi:MAG: class I adenylate-forming enzyme family protein [Microthrixaceae bacterium]
MSVTDTTNGPTDGHSGDGTDGAADVGIASLMEAWAELTEPGGAFEVQETEVRGIPMRLFKSALPNMRSLWEMAALHGDKTYVVFEDEHYSYSEVDAQVRSLAKYLDSLGIGRGDRVAIAMRNYPEWVIGYWAVVSIGAAVVGLNAWWTTPEMEYGLADSRPKVLIADDERLATVGPALTQLRAVEPLHVIAVRTERELPDDAVHWYDVVDPANAPDSLPEVQIDPDDDATIFYTSGTTGAPKGAQITHRGSVHNVFNLVFWTMVQSIADAKVTAATGVNPNADTREPPEQLVFMAPTPLFHVTACNCLLHPCTIAGGKIVLTYKWDPARALELIEREKVTNFSGVPTMGRELLAHPDWAKRDTSSIRSMAGGGAPMQPDLVEKIDKTLGGSAPSVGYGLTETTGVVTVNSARYFLAKPSSCGPVVPTLDSKLVDEIGRDLEPGPDVVGQLCVRGPVVIKGYLNRPDETERSIPDGWFNTGDVARIDDDGFVFIVDRAKDMVLRGGENVYCSEVEAAIYAHDAVLEAAVFGIPEERLGEEVAAVVVLKDSATVDAAELQAFVSERLAKFKIPTRIWLRSEPLPRNANGKFLKRELRDEMLEG